MDGLLSVIIPAYNEEQMVALAARTIGDVLTDAAIPHELLFVCDGSTDGTWQKITKLSAENERVCGICLSRNFGKEAAMFSGLSHAKGDCCVVIDCDLQHPPEKIVEMYRLWQQGYEVVEAVKADRGQERFLYRVAAKAFYGIISRTTGIDMRRASDFKLLDRKAVNVLLTMREKDAFFRAMSSWIGFRATQIEFEVRQRAVGRSKWTTRSLVRYAVHNISSFSTAPMQIVTFLGGVMLLAAVVLGCMSLVDKFRGIAPVGFTTVNIIQLFIGSIVMISLGIIGYYISKIYEEVKGRPRYIIANTCGDVENPDDIVG